MSDFTRQMALSIAQSRPRHAGGQTKPTMIPSPHMGMMGERKGVGIGVNLKGIVDAYRDITGALPPATRQQLLGMAGMAHLSWYVNSDNPELQTKLEMNPEFQKMAEKYIKAGYKGIYFSEDKNMYVFNPKPLMSFEQVQALLGQRAAEGTELTRQQERVIGADPTETQVKSGFAGEQRRADLVDTLTSEPDSVTNLRNAQAKTEEARADAIREQSRLDERRLEMDSELNAAQIALANRREDLANKELEYQRLMREQLPDEWARDKKLYDIKLQNALNEAKAIDAQISRQELEKTWLLRNMSKDQIQRLRDNDSNLVKSRLQYLKTMSYLGDNELDNFEKIGELTRLTTAHIAGVYAADGTWKDTELSMRYWMTQVDREFQRDVPTRGILGSIARPWPAASDYIYDENTTQAAIEQRQRRMYYLRSAKELLTQSQSEDGSHLLKYVEWSTELDRTFDQMIDDFTDMAIHEDTIKKLVNYAAKLYEEEEKED